MADGVRVDSLIIDVEVNAQGARNQIDALANSVRRLGGVASQADLQQLVNQMQQIRSALVGQVQTFRLAEDQMDAFRQMSERVNETLSGLNRQTGTARERTSEYKSSLRDVTREHASFTAALKSSLSGITDFWSKIKRVLTYRLIRSAIKEITDGLKTGITNVYFFSQLTGGSFSDSLDRASTQLLYMKNAIGTALAPIIEALIPIFVRVTDFIGGLADKIAEFFAAWNGERVYTSARKVAQTWGEGAESLEKAAKQTRFLISGFDELNKIPSRNESGGTGNTGADYSAMFEYKPVDSDFASTVGIVKEGLSKVVEALTPYEFAIGAVLMFAGHPLIGLGLMIHSALTFYKEQKQKSDGGTEASLIASVGLDKIATVLSVAAFAFGAIMLFSGNVPVGLGLLAGGVALAFFAKSEKNSDQGNEAKTDIMSGLKRLSDALAPAAFIFGSIMLFTGNVAVGLGLITASVAMKFFGSKENSGDDGADITKKLKGTVLSLGNALKEYSPFMYAAGVILIFTGNVLAGLALLAMPSVIKVITDGKEESLSIEGLSKSLKEIGKELVSYLTAGGAIAAALGSVALFIPGAFGIGVKLILAGLAAFGAAEALGTTGIKNELEAKLAEFAPFFAGSGLLLAFAGILVALGTGNVALAGKLIAAGAALGIAGINLGADAEAQEAAINATRAAVDPEWQKTMSKVNANVGLGTVYNPTTGNWKWETKERTWKTRASGGFVDSGDLFFANENGSPEYVASIGNRTAVANNDQIITGISNGVAVALSAYVPAIIAAIEENKTEIAIGDEQIAKSASNGNAAFRRMTGRSLPGLA